jgi:5'-3' exonuclease
MRKLYIDGNNTFIRHYVVNPALNTQGYPVGGILGFLRDIGNLVHMSSAEEVIVVWDSKGGSVRKKQIMREYKEGRKTISPKLNRQYDEDPEDAQRNKFYQMERLVHYLDYTPIKQVQIRGVEADDVIAFLAQRDAREGHKCVVVSMDKDFLQIINNGIVVYKPVKKEVFGVESVRESYGMYPRNFALYRSMLGKGDESDNIKGIRGVGEKTFIKHFPMFEEDRDIGIDEVLEYCEANKKKRIKYSRCIEGRDIIERNYKISQLYSPMLNTDQVLEIEAQLEENDGNYQYHNLLVALKNDGFVFFDALGKTFNVLKGLSINY